MPATSPTPTGDATKKPERNAQAFHSTKTSCVYIDRVSPRYSSPQEEVVRGTTSIIHQLDHRTNQATRWGIF